MTQLSQREIEGCLEQLELLKKIKEINLMGKKLGLGKFKKTEKVLAREMIVQKLHELQGQGQEEDDEDLIGSDSDLESLGDELVPEMVEEVVDVVEEVPEMVEEVVDVVEEVPEMVEEIVDVCVVKDTKMMYQTINQMVKNLMKNEEDMENKNELLEKTNKSHEVTNKKLNVEFNNLYSKYQLVVSENEKLESSNMKLKECVRNLMGNM